MKSTAVLILLSAIAAARSSFARRGNPGVESAIGALQSGNRLVRCRDRTEGGFQRYIHLGVLGRNLHVLGKIVLAREDADCLAAQSRRRKAAA